MTAVEWLEMEIVKLETKFAIPGDIYQLCEQAKEIEKQQIDEICADWWNEGASYMYDGKRNYLSFEQYYNEKFKK